MSTIQQEARAKCLLREVRVKANLVAATDDPPKEIWVVWAYQRMTDEGELQLFNCTSLPQALECVRRWLEGQSGDEISTALFGEHRAVKFV